MDLNHKIKQILLEKNLSPSQFADDIGVQRSSISHILAGRNRPSLDIIKKIVNTYTDIEIEWLLDIDHNETETISSTPQKASSGRDSNQFHTSDRLQSFSRDMSRNNRGIREDIYPSQYMDQQPSRGRVENQDAPLEVERILVFYSNGTFKEFKPG